MHPTRDAIPSSRHAAWPACLWLFLALAFPCVAPAPAWAAAPPSAPAVCTASLPVAAWYDKIWHKIETSLNNRTGAIQFGLIGMLIALWIIWWRK